MLPGPEPLRLLQGAIQLFAAMAQAFEQARDEIYLETYIFDFSRSAATLAQALMRAARRGVQVRLMVDGAGTGQLPPFWAQQFDAAGVQWRVFAPIGSFGLLLPSRWRRLHRKLCVVDMATGFCGGINIIDDHHDIAHGFLTRPRLDFAVQFFDVPLVAQVHTAMAQLWWRSQLGQDLREKPLGTAWDAMRQVDSRLGAFEVSSRQTGPDQTLVTALLLRDNILNRRRIERAYLKAIGAARDEILIANAYFLPGGRLRRALRHAVRRGVRVRIVVQGRYEGFLQHHAAQPVFDGLLHAGVELWQYQASFLHAKVAVVDTDTRQPWATVGSSNLDPLSLLLAREANIVSRDPDFARQLHERLQDAIAHGCVALDRTAFDARSLTARARDWLAYGLVRLALLIAGIRY